MLRKGVGVADRLVADYPHTALYAERLSKLKTALKDAQRKANRPNEAAAANRTGGPAHETGRRFSERPNLPPRGRHLWE